MIENGFELYNIYNQKSEDFCVRLQEKEEEISRELGHKNEFNLIHIFFHEIVQFYTKKVFCESFDYSLEYHMLYVNGNIPRSYRLINLINLLNQRVNISLNLPIRLVRESFLTFIIKGCFHRSHIEKVFIPDFYIQLKKLESHLTEHYITNDEFVILRDQIKGFVSDSPISIDEDIYLTGSNLDLGSRLMSATFLQNKKKVVSLAHGEHSSVVFDEPVFWYAELTLSSIYVDYGRFLVSRKYTGEKIVYRSSSSIKKIRSLSQKADFEIVYVPTSFSRGPSYGPYRALPNKLYAQWMNSLLAASHQMKVKWHPKSKLSIEVDQRRVIYSPLEKVIDRVEIFVFDYVSSAFAQACASNAEIIFLDCGIRRLRAEALEIIRGRCHYYKFESFDNLESKLKEVLKTAKESKKRDLWGYSNQFSLLEYNESEIDSIMKNL